MGLMSTLLGEGNSNRQTEDYVELSADQLTMEDARANTHVHIARIGEQTDVIDIKDAVYDGDVVVADITRHTTNDQEMEHIIDQLRQVADEVNGDIVQKDDDQIIVTPTGVKVSRSRLGK
jgi:SepF-like predicted cell division protein (DUF552 family)